MVRNAFRKSTLLEGCNLLSINKEALPAPSKILFPEADLHDDAEEEPEQEGVEEMPADEVVDAEEL
jgi:hypothetical protein